jgi:hypothetical protein
VSGKAPKPSPYDDGDDQLRETLLERIEEHHQRLDEQGVPREEEFDTDESYPDLGEEADARMAMGMDPVLDKDEEARKRREEMGFGTPEEVPRGFFRHERFYARYSDADGVYVPLWLLREAQATTRMSHDREGTHTIDEGPEGHPS